MTRRNRLAAMVAALALTTAPVGAYAQSQATKTGTGQQAGAASGVSHRDGSPSTMAIVTTAAVLTVVGVSLAVVLGLTDTSSSSGTTP